uniref:Protein KTI12 homolog n=1 Tax=Ciona intestinalis TaxID=7719 RepID=F6X3L7_CIOIN|nr:protein KTI12 homolog [Ciona intestinalis]|eukprot:XP_026695236.1 protein KTI12 homolog [Ciona intestinalis]
MPLVVMCGGPCTGKTTRCGELNKYLNQHHPDVNVVVASDLNIVRDSVFADSRKEIETRGALKSAVERDVSDKNVVIVDSMNYIKGFRYELHCVSKYGRTTYCVIHCAASIQQIYQFNEQKKDGEKYSKEILDGLMQRFEAPNSMSRWDSPLFTINPDDKLPSQDICDAIFKTKKQKPNLSTQNPPLMSPTFVYEADKMLQSIGASILASQKTSGPGDVVSLPDTNETYTISDKLSVADMRRQRKQFLIYLRANPVSDIKQVPKMFLYFLSNSVS